VDGNHASGREPLRRTEAAPADGNSVLACDGEKGAVMLPERSGVGRKERGRQGGRKENEWRTAKQGR
jgi:hypothetical protein